MHCSVTVWLVSPPISSTPLLLLSPPPPLFLPSHMHAHALLPPQVQRPLHRGRREHLPRARPQPRLRRRHRLYRRRAVHHRPGACGVSRAPLSLVLVVWCVCALGVRVWGRVRVPWGVTVAGVTPSHDPPHNLHLDVSAACLTQSHPPHSFPPCWARVHCTTVRRGVHAHGAPDGGGVARHGAAR